MSYTPTFLYNIACRAFSKNAVCGCSEAQIPLLDRQYGAYCTAFSVVRKKTECRVDNIHVETYKFAMTEKENENAGLANEIGKKGAFASLEQETFLNLMRTHALLSSEFKQKLFRPLGLSHEKYNVLRILAGEKKPMQIYEVAERMIAPKTDISRLIERLVDSELISRERCSQDGRVVWVKLTSKGKAVLKKLGKPLDELHASQFGNLSRKELETLNRLLFKARG